MTQFDNKNIDTSMNELEFQILDILRLHGREINPDFGDHGKQIYDYEELSLFTHEEIAKASREMYARGWIYIFDDGTPYWHELLDKGRIALREHLKMVSKDELQQPNNRKPTYIREQNNYNCQQFFGSITGCTFTMPVAQTNSQDAGIEETDNIIKELMPIFKNSIENAKAFLKSIDGAKSTFVTSEVNRLLKEEKITRAGCKGELWKVLSHYKLYKPSESNWNQQVNA